MKRRKFIERIAGFLAAIPLVGIPFREKFVMAETIHLLNPNDAPLTAMVMKMRSPVGQPGDIDVSWLDEAAEEMVDAMPVKKVEYVQIYTSPSPRWEEE